MNTLLIVFIVVILLYVLCVIRYRSKFPLFMPNEERETFYTGMDKTQRILNENNIPYFIICGTLLGSIRHGDIIPWDDDIDIGILEEDMERFNSIDFKRYGYESAPASENGCGKIFLNEKLYIDIFPFQKLNGRYQYLEPRARKMWPSEYFLEEELFPLKQYKFGNLSLSGPNKSKPYANRSWGENWQKPVFKWKKMLLYPVEMFKLYFLSSYTHNE